VAVIRFRVDGVPYALEIDEKKGAGSLTPREWGIVKRISRVLPADMGDAAAGGDQELYAALAIVAMRRAGVDVDEDAILDGKYPMEIEGEDDDAGPPAEAAEGGAEQSG
jgi:hypothetical protein